MPKQEIGSCNLMVAITPQTEEVINFYFFFFWGGGGGTLRPLILCIKTSVTVSKVYLLTDDFSMEQKRFLSVR